MQSEYGYRIKNIQAASVFEMNNGVRDRLDMEDAMLTNSLFLDHLLQIGMKSQNLSTRDLVCLCFDYGSRSYEDEIKHLDKQISNTKKNEKLSAEEQAERIKKFESLRKQADSNQDKYIKLSGSELRKKYYTEGMDITWNTYNRSGNVIDSNVIHYKMLFRSAGKAKVGKVMFIRKELYQKASSFLRMGITIPLNNAPIVEIGAYQSLIASTIVDRIHIDPRNILILKDYESFMETNVVSIETDELKQCHAVQRDNYRIKSTLFDGQGLVDSSIFPDWGDGYILLRQHFFKAACFCTHIQKFFKDHYGDEYERAVIKDMFGVEHKVKDIKLITTDNACKFIKFQVPYEYWCDKVLENGGMFGIVKTAHKSKLGNVQKASYQMINALDMDLMDGVTRCTKDYIMSMKLDDNVFMQYLRDNSTYTNDYDVLIALVEQDRDFLRSDYFRERKKIIIANYLLNVKSGKVINNADNLVLVGSPYAMLMYAVGLDPEDDPTFSVEKGAIQCYTERFYDGEYLAAFRSPMNGPNNISCVHNVYHDYFKKYFNFGTQILAVNCVHTDWEDRNNGLTYWASVQKCA